jgi:hypothetical protein
MIAEVAKPKREKYEEELAELFRRATEDAGLKGQSPEDLLQ